MKQDPNDLLEQINTALDEGEAASLLKDEKFAEAARLTRELRQFVSGDGRTGNSFRDALLRSDDLLLFPPSEKRLAEYQTLDEQVRKHAGQLLLVIATHKSTDRHDKDYLEQVLYLGVLNGNGLNVDIEKGTISLPLSSSAWWHDGKSTKVEKPIELRDSVYAYLSLSRMEDLLTPKGEWTVATIRYLGHLSVKGLPALEIVVGDEAVRRCLVLKQCKKYAEIYAELTALLDRPGTLHRQAAA